jgi:DNA-binding winged helix-turn-helix (wHTH) protein/WD40 repeat protein
VEEAVHSPRIVRFGTFEVHLRTGELHKAEVRLKLTGQPFQVLAILLEHPGEVVTREELQKRLWPDTFVDVDHNLNTAINKIREALGDSAESPQFVETLPRRGYRFIASVEGPGEANGGDGPQISSMKFDAGTRGDSSYEGKDPARASTWRRASLVFGVVALLLGALIVGWLVRGRVSSDQGVNRGSLEIRKLSDTGYVDLVAISPDGRYVAYASRKGEKVSLHIRQTESGGDVEILPPEEVNFAGLTFSVDGSYLYFSRSDKNDPGFHYLYMMPALGGPTRKLLTGIDSPVSFSPDGRQFVFTRGIPTKNQIEVRIANSDGSGDHLLTIVEESYWGYQPGATWSPDGRTIAVPVLHLGKRIWSALHAVDVAGGSQRELYSTDGFVGRPPWLPGGRGMLVELWERSRRRGQLWTISFPRGETARVTNDLSNYGESLDLTRDGKMAVVQQGTRTSNIWASSLSGNTHLQQITSGESPMYEAIEVDSGNLLVVGRAELWIMKPDGTDRALFSKLNADQMCKAGKFVVATVRSEDTQHITRLDSDGVHAVSLASGSVASPTCAPDGKFVFYADLSGPQRIVKVPIEGGTPVEIAAIPGDGMVGPVDVSNDGKFLTFPWEQFGPVPGVHLSVISSRDGSLAKSFAAPPGVFAGCVRWSRDDNALQYILTRNGISNLWQQSLAGGAPKQLTNFSSGLIFHFNWTRDGRRLLLARGNVTSDAVLLSNLR